MGEHLVAREAIPSVAPGVSPAARRAVRRLVRPIERFLHIEAASGIVLLACTVIALAWVNSRFGASYAALWHTPVTAGIGRFTASASLHFVVNDVLMVVFFFVVGLEIRREVHDGELADFRRAALPIGAAIGGMVAPAALFLLVSPGGAARRGWGVPMATDIAFAVGVLALLGRRVPSALRVLLLALAIVDDIGAIVVIAIFYSTGFAWSGVAFAAAGLAAVLVMQRIGVRHASAYVLPGIVVWFGVLRAGVHPTIAGVVLGLLTPARAWFGRAGFLAVADEALDEIRKQDRENADDDDAIGPLMELGRARREALPPVVRIQHALHPWVAFVIMPVFALANAGVPLVAPSGDVGLAVAIALGLAVGKPLGIVATCALLVRLRIARLPLRVDFRGLLVVGAVAGIGFTMALFVSELAFVGSPLLNTAKMGVLAGSAVSAVVALGFGRAALVPPREDVTASEAERSAES